VVLGTPTVVAALHSVLPSHLGASSPGEWPLWKFRRSCAGRLLIALATAWFDPYARGVGYRAQHPVGSLRLASSDV